jgi:hypothetical protein
MKRPELHLGDLAVEVRERVAELALKATDDGGQPAPHEQTPAYYDQTLGGRIYLARPSGESRTPALAAMPVQQAPKPTETQRTVLRPQRPSAAGESCARNGFETYCASSVLRPQFGNSYGVANLFDSSTGTAWVEGQAGNGVGEWITVEFDTLRSVKSFTVQNGYQKNYDIFHKNNRVRQLRVVFSGGETHTFTLEDRITVQSLALARPVQSYWMKFVIEEVWAGNKYKDTAVTKLRVDSDLVQ